jgi:hypothetical protein
MEKFVSTVTPSLNPFQESIGSWVVRGSLCKEYSTHFACDVPEILEGVIDPFVTPSGIVNEKEQLARKFGTIVAK